MSTLGQWFFEREKASILEAVTTRSPYTARVATIGTGSDRTVTIVDPFTGATELQRLTVVGSMPLVNGKVLIVPLKDGERVALAVAGGNEAHTGPSGDLISTVIGTGANAVLRGTAVGSYSYSADAGTAFGYASNASGYIGTALGWDAEAGGQGSIALGYISLTDSDSTDAIAIGWMASVVEAYGIAIGSTASAGLEAIAIGATASAIWYGTALGDGATAAHQAVAIGRGASAGGIASIAIGHGASESTNFAAQILADYLYIKARSANPSYLYLNRPDGGAQAISIRNDERLLVGSSQTVKIGDNPGTVFYPNRKVGASAAPLKSYVSNNAGGVSMPAGHEIFIYGPGSGISAEGFTWVCCISGTYGFGYVRHDLTVAL